MGNRKKRKRRARQPPKRVARNPGVSSLLLVNPAPAPKKAVATAPSPAQLKQHIQSAVRTALKGRKMPKRAKRATASPAKPPKKKRRRSSPRRAAHSAPTVQIINGQGGTQLKPKIRRKRDNHSFDLNLAKQYRGVQTRKGKWRGKHEKRGIKTLEAHKKSILWNIGKGSPGAQQWVLDHIPKINPASDLKETGIDLAVGLASFLGSRVAGNFAGHVPGLSSLGSIGSMGASAIVTGVSYYLLGKKWPKLKKPLLFGGALALLDKIVKSYVVPHLPPTIGGALGDAPDHGLEAYDDPMMGYLPPHDAMDGCCDQIDPAEYERIHQEQLAARSMMGFDVHPAMADYGDGLGFDVHPAMADAGDGLGYAVREAMADSGDGLGLEVHEAQAGVDDLGAYLPRGTGAADLTEQHEGAYGAYVSQPAVGTGAYVPSMGDYVPTSGMGDAQEVAAMMFGGPMALAQLNWLRRRRHRRHRHPHHRFGHRPLHRPWHHLPRQSWHSQSREHGMMGFNDGPLPPHLRSHHGHHGHGHHGRRIHAECDFYLPRHGHRHHGHHVALPVHPDATSVAPPTGPVTSPPPAPHSLMGSPGGIFGAGND